MDLYELYAWCEQEWGKPLVIHPQGYGVESYTVEAGGEPMDCYWAILEYNGRRRINFLISAHKSIPEGAGPAFYDCPEYFFELVPEEDPTWRERVREYWRQLATGKMR
ncbi:hypothetical protein CW735_09065 [Alteromonas sp. MB-3u-76]|uniref:hypothetical protein n=1 Tax=Alteromonas sp. MB-3u-76 TaxID=2058133 RepID=UPI000C3137C3|nr:hypothetical protein [Alteromonas sp. MB-3u-76]AUC88321.1 hypothetical protein CW735_09065 [Alteromonas sp. MB-3u-76]